MAPTPLWTVAREWTRIGVTGFGGPPAHIALLRPLVVERLGLMDAEEFQDVNAACGLLPGPASTQLAILCAWRAAGPAGAIVGGLGFIAPAVITVIALSALFLAHHPPLWVRGAGVGAGAAVPAVALAAARQFLEPSWAGVREDAVRRLRWLGYVAVGILAAAFLGADLILALLACGAVELNLRRRGSARLASLSLLPATVTAGGLGALAWTALKVGALSFGGGFVIIPLMRGDAVSTHHWMSASRFLDAVALGQITPGPVVATVAAVGYAATGVAGGVLAAVVAFAPSFAFVLVGARRFDRLRQDPDARAFLDGAGPGAIGAIIGSAIVLAVALAHLWPFVVLAGALVAMFGLRRGVVATLLGAGVIGALAAVLLGAPT